MRLLRGGRSVVINFLPFRRVHAGNSARFHFTILILSFRLYRELRHDRRTNDAFVRAFMNAESLVEDRHIRINVRDKATFRSWEIIREEFRVKWGDLPV